MADLADSTGTDKRRDPQDDKAEARCYNARDERRPMNEISGIRDLLRELVRAYSMHVPFQRGKDRLRVTLEPFIRPRTKTIVTEVPYGQSLEVFCGEYVSDHIYYYGCFETELVMQLGEALEPGMVFLDVGAHVGLYSIVAAARVGETGKVFAFEPSEETFGLLARNAARSKADVIECTRAAVSSEEGFVELHLGDKSIRASSTMGKATYTSNSETVPTVTLDGFLAARGITAVDAIKMDIEGAERLALLGAHDLLAGPGAPGLIQIELDERHTTRFGHSTQEVTGLLRDAGYEIYDLIDGSLRLLDTTRPLLAKDGVALKRGTRIAENVVRRTPIR